MLHCDFIGVELGTCNRREPGEEGVQVISHCHHHRAHDPSIGSATEVSYPVRSHPPANRLTLHSCPHPPLWSPFPTPRQPRSLEEGKSRGVGWPLGRVGQPTFFRSIEFRFRVPRAYFAFLPGAKVSKIDLLACVVCMVAASYANECEPSQAGAGSMA